MFKRFHAYLMRLCLLLGLLSASAAPVMAVVKPTASCSSAETAGVALSAERQAIEYLRRQYAMATDLVGMGGKENLDRARTIYRRIFTDDAHIQVVIEGRVTRRAIGPDKWLAQVQLALGRYSGVQHLIGTQIVEIGCTASGGPPDEATMSSYLQAWHDRSGEHVYLFIGTYHDRVRRVPGVGWQIYDMQLHRVSAQHLPR